jgi:hypothetical protein
MKMRLAWIALLLQLMTGCGDLGTDYTMVHDPIDHGLVTNLGAPSDLGSGDILGRWTVARVTTLTFPKPLPPKFTLLLDVRHAAASYHKQPFAIMAGGRSIDLLGYKDSRQYQFLFENVEPGTRTIEIHALAFDEKTPESLFIQRLSIESADLDHCILCQML